MSATVHVVSGDLTQCPQIGYTVRMPDTRESQWIAERHALPGLLTENRNRRDAIEAERTAARNELQELVTRGYRVALPVKEMARLAGISRETVHGLLRESGVKTWRDRISEGRKATKDG
jgi:hypothetical protein